VPGRSIRLHPNALSEMLAARLWYEARSSIAALAFVDELEIALTRIESSPMRAPPHIESTRRFMLRRFPFAIVYRVDPDAILVFAVAHMSRRPGYWRLRKLV